MRHFDKLTAEHNKEKAYIVNGFNSWKKALTAFNEHQASKAHTAASAFESLVPKCGDVKEMTLSFKKQRLTERKYLLKIMDCIRYLARLIRVFQSR